MKTYALLGIAGVVALGVSYALSQVLVTTPNTTPMQETNEVAGTQYKTAIFAGGCFWCVEHDFGKISDGLIDVVSGYSGGESENPTYENYADGGHREVVEVTYDPAVIEYGTLVEYLLRHIDPTDAGGSFNDRGEAYTSAIYFENEDEQKIALDIIAKIDEEKVFEKAIVTPVLPKLKFWPAEGYHQDYAKNHVLKYGYFRNASGRDAFIKRTWKGKEITIHQANVTSPDTSKASTSAATASWKDFVKPSDEVLKQKLTPLQYKVTQEDGTETPFKNEYNDEKRDGIFVDIVSGEPLYSSKDKYESGTGWPSFVAPITKDAVALKEDKGFFTSRTEVRSKLGDSHLGHVFPDGPADRGGMRYCMNSAAMRFILKEDLTKEGYGEYLTLFI